MERITFCIPSKSNLQYLKTCIPSIRANAFNKEHDIIIFVDSDEDGTVEWLEQNKYTYSFKYFVNPYLGEKLFGIGEAYDFCVEKSETDVFMIFHADMILGHHADRYALNLLKPGTVVCSTRIEPPLHPNAGEKIIEDFGVWPEEFKEKEFLGFVKEQIAKYKDTTTVGIFAPWMMYKKEFLAIGGHDPILKSAREDSDVFNRLKLKGYNFVQSWESLVYHFTGRGGQFQHGKLSTEHSEKSLEWQRLMANSTKEFIRKWGSVVKHTHLMDPIISPKYNIGIDLKDDKVLNLLELLEPFCSTLYTDDLQAVDQYIEKEQPNTMFDLRKRLKPSKHSAKINDIIVEINLNKFNQHDYMVIQDLSSIIKESGEIGVFEIGNLLITIDQMREFQTDLIQVKNPPYHSFF